MQRNTIEYWKKHVESGDGMKGEVGYPFEVLGHVGRVVIGGNIIALRSE